MLRPVVIAAILAMPWGLPFASGQPVVLSTDAGRSQFSEPVLSTASSMSFVDPERQNTLVEMWTRRIVSPRSDAWSPDDLALLQRIRAAEKSGALGLLREGMGTLRGSVVERRIGSGEKKLWLTKEGFGQYFFLLSQNARRYFEDMGTDAKFVFMIRDLNGKKIFNKRGLLAPAGEDIYSRILRGESVQWKNPNGETLSNVHPVKQ